MADSACGDGAVFTAESKKHPNHGKEMGMNASEWWANVGGISIMIIISYAVYHTRY